MSGIEDRSIGLQDLIRRTRLWMAGMMYHGRRDLYELFGYNRNPKQLDYVARYLRQDIAKRIIDAPILAVWADPPQLDADPAFLTAWNVLINSQSPIKLIATLIRLDKLAALGQFALLVLGFDDGADLSRPVKSKQGRKLLYMQPYAEMTVRVKEYDKDQQSSRFGQPILYTVSPGRFSPEIRTGMISQFVQEQRAPFDVHYTRVVHVAENLLEDSTFGRSRMEIVVNLLDDILKTAGGSAETHWLTANRGMQADVDKDMDLDETSAADLSQEIEEYQHDLRRFIRTRGVKITPLGSESSDPSGVFNMLIALISAATGIPQMVLMGSQVGKMASQQDRANWAERILERITEYEEPIVFLPLLARLIEAGVLPQPQNLQVSWPEAFKLSPLERSQTSAQMARSAANLTKTMSLLGGNGSGSGPNGNNATGDGTSPPAPAAAPQPLFTRDEMRKIVGFGKRMPVFDGTSNSPSSQVDRDNNPNG